MKQTPPQTIRVMIIDDHKLMRQGLRMLLTSKAGFEVVCEAENSMESLACAQENQPDVILLDLDLGGESGLELLPKLLEVSKQSSVLVLTGIREQDVHHKAMSLGAMGVVQKEIASDVLLKAIQKIKAGEIWYDRSKFGSVLQEIRRNGNGKQVDPHAERIATLTRREHEVIAYVSQGLKNKEVGEKLYICETTVRHHLTSIFEKLQVSSRLELIILAFSQGLAVVPKNHNYPGNGYRNVVASHTLNAENGNGQAADAN
jgi:two-component system, NarL family, nitrate/nitrite response regulator NarL